ncbi:MAG: RcpC/CpaB family pilus assembly protein [Bacillota bacterium]|nr:RcpC/CpaB family pilus assembly protein [Bacillota bacterium]
MAPERPRTWIWFALAAVFALLAGVTAHVYLASLNRTETVVVAKATVPPMSMIDPSLLTTASVPATAAPADALRSIGDAAGKFTAVGIAKGAVVTKAMLLSVEPGGSGSVWDARLLALESDAATRGLQAFPLPLDQSGGYTLIQAGDRVDVLVAARGAQGPAQASAVVAGALVLGKIDQGGSSNNANVVGLSGGGSGQQQSSAQSGVVVLALARQDAERLLTAEASGGKLALILDNPAEPARAADAGPATAGPAPAAGAQAPAAPASGGTGQAQQAAPGQPSPIAPPAAGK